MKRRIVAEPRRPKVLPLEVPKRRQGPRGRSLHVNERREQLHQKQCAAIWKWRWLGWRDSTPGFKGMLVVLLAGAIYLGVRALT